MLMGKLQLTLPTPRVISPIPNPWLNIGWDLDRVADCDESYLASWSNSKYIQMNTLPEPYTGDVDSNVYCLDLNPGNACICDTSALKIKDDFEDYTNDTLDHFIRENMWFSPLFKGTACYKWWQQKTKWLRKWLQKNKKRLDSNPRMFVIEYFPYHTDKVMKFPTDLPSYDYSNELIRQAMEKDKYIIIMRYWKAWLKRIPGLATYGKLARLKNPQSPCLPSNNIDTLENFDLDDLLDEIPELKTYGKLARLKNPQNPCLTANNIDTLGNFPLGDLLNAF